MALDESNKGSQIVFQGSMDEDQELPASVTLTSGIEHRESCTSVSDPCDWDDVYADLFPLPDVSMGMCHYNDAVDSLLISISCEEGPEEHSAWGCHYSSWWCREGHGKIQCSQGYPRNHTCRLCQSPSSLTTLYSKLFPYQRIYRKPSPSGTRSKTSSHI